MGGKSPFAQSRNIWTLSVGQRNKYGARARLRPQGMGKRSDDGGGDAALQRGVGVSRN